MLHQDVLDRCLITDHIAGEIPLIPEDVSHGFGVGTSGYSVNTEGYIVEENNVSFFCSFMFGWGREWLFALRFDFCW